MRRVLALLLVALVALPIAMSATSEPPSNAALQTGTKSAFAAWVGNESSASNEPVAPGAAIVAWFAAHAFAPATDPNATRYALVNISPNVETFAAVRVNLSIAPNGTAWAIGNVTVPTSANASTAGSPAFYYNATVFESSGNQTIVLDSFGGSGPNVVVATVAPAPPAGLPTTYLVGGGIVLLLAVAVGAYGLRQRNVRRRMRGKTRSTTLQQLEQEEKAKKPEQVAQVQQEIRQQEVVRSQRREMQILEAKRADAQKGLELLKKRHEMGGLSKLQFESMVAKKQADLQRVEAEIAEMEAADAGDRSAAA